ncbi:pilus assembly protein TadG-related protein [Pseudooceanicola onchidii]|uniref:pilus assembly protein TadG-related protein n=1 Tax=Pseudooceanicola onchidii TaxID=2562279 RepID=UPI001F0F0DBC|nr:pilus assembly protein TadG-related protein [Pseudooceanicola onchidii]
MLRLGRDDRGSITLLSLYLLAGILAVSALAVDFSHLLAARNQLQVAADAAAHAALYHRERNSASSAKIKAVELAQHSMPQASYGAVLRTEDVEFGYWDYATRTFTPNPYSMSAVRVRPGRTAARGNSVAAYLFRMIDRPFWDLSAQAIFVAFEPPCFREGFIGEDVVDIQSNNGFENGFCVHSNRYVSVNSNNTWEAGTVVSMPDSSEIDLPRSGFVTNEGLQAALRNGYYRLRVLGQIDRIYDDLYLASGAFLPDYISGAAPVVLTDWKLDASDFVPGRVHRVSCSNHDIQITAGTVLQYVVIVTDCPVKFGNGVTLEDSVVFSRSTDNKSIYAASSLQIGKNDNCAEGGGAQIITYGGMDVPSDLRFFGGQVIAKKAVSFAANAGGIQGASIISGSTISGTSNMTMGFCGAGMEDNFEVPYFRLAY